MPTTKNALQSKTIWGALLALASMLLARFGFELDPETQGALLSQAMSAIDEVTGIVGLIMVVWGRFTAKADLVVAGVNGAKLGALALAMIVSLSAGCAGVPAGLVAQHLDTAGADHERRIAADGGLRPVEREVWASHYSAMRDAVAAAEGGGQ